MFCISANIKFFFIRTIQRKFVPLPLPILAFFDFLLIGLFFFKKNQSLRDFLKFRLAIYFFFRMRLRTA